MEKLDEKLEKRFEYLVIYFVMFIFTGALAVSMELTFSHYEVVSLDTLTSTIILFLFLLTWARPSSFLGQALIFIGLSFTLFIFLLYLCDVSHDIIDIVIKRCYLFFLGIPLFISSLLLLIKILIYKKMLNNC